MQGHYILRVPDTSPSRCQEIGPDRVTWLPETDPARALAFGCREAGGRMPQQALRRRLARVAPMYASHMSIATACSARRWASVNWA